LALLGCAPSQHSILRRRLAIGLSMLCAIRIRCDLAIVILQPSPPGIMSIFQAAFTCITLYISVFSLAHNQSACVSSNCCFFFHISVSASASSHTHRHDTPSAIPTNTIVTISMHTYTHRHHHDSCMFLPISTACHHIYVIPLPCIVDSLPRLICQLSLHDPSVFDRDWTRLPSLVLISNINGLRICIVCASERLVPPSFPPFVMLLFLIQTSYDISADRLPATGSIGIGIRTHRHWLMEA